MSTMTTPAATPSRRPRRSGLRASVILPIIVLLGGAVGGGAWLRANRSNETRKIAAADKFTVEPRSFRVSFKEKGEIKAARNEEVLCEVEGRSTIIEVVKEGQFVKAGELVVELATNEIDDRIESQEREEARALDEFKNAETELALQLDRNASDIRKGDLAVHLAEIELQKYVDGDWVLEWQAANIAIEQAEVTLERRQADYEASITLFERKFITEAEFKEDEFNQMKAAWELDKARHSLQIFETYTTTTTLAKLHSDVEEAQKDLERIIASAAAEEDRRRAALAARSKELASNRDTLQRLRTQRAKCRIVAPIDGYVIYGSQSDRPYWGGNDDQIRKGAQVSERQVLLTIPDTSRMVVITKIHESKITRIRMGQAVDVDVEGLPGKHFTGKVSRIALLASSRDRWMNPDLKEYETELTLDQVDDGLKPGQTARAEILVDEAVDAVAIPNQAVYSKAGRRFAFRWASDGAVEPVQIKLGRTNTEWAEVTSGLNTGDQVLLSFGDAELRLIPELAPLEEASEGEGRPGGRGPGRGPRTGGGETAMNKPAATPSPEAATKPEAATTPIDATAAEDSATTAAEPASSASVGTLP